MGYLATQYKERDYQHGSWNYRAFGPNLQRKSVLRPTHAEPDAQDPQKLPGPQIERPHFIKRDSCGNEAHHEIVFRVAKTELRHEIQNESSPQNELPSEPARQQKRRGRQGQENNVHG